MRIRIEDDFDSELENEYKSIDNDSNVGNGKLSNSSGTIIDVDPTDVKATDVEVDQATNDNSCKENVDKPIISEKDKKKVKTYNLDNGFSLELQGATFIDDNEEVNDNKEVNDNSNYANQKVLEDDNIKERLVENEDKIINNSNYTKARKKEKRIVGKITVISKLGDRKGSNISDAKINLYALNGLSPKMISSKYTDKNGVVIFDNLSEGSYRVIEIVNRKYFEKPTYIQWNEVTINDELREESIIVINKIKHH